jgi:hypothetical protein
MSTEILWPKFLRSVKFGCGNEYQNVNIQTDFNRSLENRMLIKLTVNHIQRQARV